MFKLKWDDGYWWIYKDDVLFDMMGYRSEAEAFRELSQTHPVEAEELAAIYDSL
jgi:hypothetical protein